MSLEKITAAVLALAAIGGAAWVTGAPATGEANSPAALRTAEVTAGQAVRTSTFRGSVDFASIAEVVSPASGSLRFHGSALGQVVAAGEIIATIGTAGPTDNSSAAHWLADYYPAQQRSMAAERTALADKHAAERAAAQARLAALEELGDYPEAALDLRNARADLRALAVKQAAEASVLQARAAALSQQRADHQVQSAAARESGHVVRAPIRGTVTALSLQPGQETVEAGQHMMTVVDESARVITVRIAAEESAMLVQLPRARCSLPGRGVTAACELKSITREGEGHLARYQLPADFAAEFGEAGEVMIEEKSRHQGLLVPRAALRLKEGGMAVERLREGQRRFVPVRVTYEGSRQAVVEGDLKLGDKVVVGE